MKTYKHNGEYWCVDDTPLWRRIVTWLVWFGGWDRWVGDRRRLEISGAPWPLSMLGHTVTVYGHWFQVRIPGHGWLVVVLERDGRGRVKRGVERAYLSRDATPDRAHVWLLGVPYDVRAAVADRQAELARRDAARIAAKPPRAAHPGFS